MSLVDWIDLPARGDERGGLVAIESGRNLPFEVKRVYYIFGISEGASRGFHAHKQLRQVAVCVAGSCEMLLDDGKEQIRVRLDDPAKAIAIEPLVWHEMHDFSKDCVLVVFASEFYHESDYIRTYDSFLGEVKV